MATYRKDACLLVLGMDYFDRMDDLLLREFFGRPCKLRCTASGGKRTRVQADLIRRLGCLMVAALFATGWLRAAIWVRGLRSIVAGRWSTHSLVVLK